MSSLPFPKDDGFCEHKRSGQLFVDFNDMRGSIFPVVISFTEKPENNRLLPISVLEGFLSPLLVLKPDPRKQYWRLELVAHRLQYLGEFESWAAAQASWFPHTHRALEDHMQLNFYMAVKLLGTIDRHVKGLRPMSISVSEEEVPGVRPVQTYIAVMSQYNRAFGESPDWEETFDALDQEEAKKIANERCRAANPDTYVKEVKLKPA